MDVLHRAQVKVALENTICHKNWGGRMIATCSVTAPSFIICDALVSVKAPGKKVAPTGKVDRTAIVFGESPVKLCRHPYTCFVVRSSLPKLKEFYTNAFDGGKDAIYFRSAYRAKNPIGDFFTAVSHTIRDGKRHKTEKDLREDVDALFEHRFTHVVRGNEGDGKPSQIFRLVRFDRLVRDTIPMNYATFIRRFPQKYIGMQANCHTEWKKSLRGLFDTTKREQQGFAKRQYEQRVVSAEKNKQKKALSECKERVRSLKKTVAAATEELRARKRNHASPEDVAEAAEAKAAAVVRMERMMPAAEQALATAEDCLAAIEATGVAVGVELVTPVVAAERVAEAKVTVRDAVLPIVCYDVPKLSFRVQRRAFASNLDFRAFRDSLAFLSTCAEHWAVARDFPTAVMDYVLKPCERRAGCLVCKPMLEAHRKNLDGGCIDRILYPGSPFLRRRGQKIFSKNLRECIAKWTDFAAFPNHTPKVDEGAFRRLQLFIRLNTARSKRAATVLHLSTFDDAAFEGNWLFDLCHGKEVPDGSESESYLWYGDFGGPTSLTEVVAEMANVLDRESIVRVASREYALANDLLQELELCVLLRTTPVYTGLPVEYGGIVFPNKALKKFYEDFLDKLEDEDREHMLPQQSLVVCVAFARRWRTRDLVRKIKHVRAAGKQCALSIDLGAPFVFAPQDDVQDWFRQLRPSVVPDVAATRRPPFSLRTGFAFSFQPQTTTKPYEVTRVEQLKEMMDKAVEGECYVLCALNAHRETLLEDSLMFRNNMSRRVLQRSFPVGERASYALTSVSFQHKSEDEQTIGTPAYFNIFGPRRDVYCVGQQWTDTDKAAALYLATGNVYEVKVTLPEFAAKWNFNDNPMTFASGQRVAQTAGDYNEGAFIPLHSFLGTCDATLDVKRKKNRECSDAERRRAHVLKLRRTVQERFADTMNEMDEKEKI